MAKSVRLFALGLITLSLIACGKTKAQKRAKNNVNEHNAIVQELNATPLPTEATSDEEINRLEAKVNRLEKLNADLGKANGKDNVKIKGANNTDSIASWRTAIQMARANKTIAKESKELLIKLRGRQNQSPAATMSPEDGLTWQTTEQSPKSSGGIMPTGEEL